MAPRPKGEVLSDGADERISSFHHRWSKTLVENALVSHDETIRHCIAGV
jgi:hypothetical protein